MEGEVGFQVDGDAVDRPSSAGPSHARKGSQIVLGLALLAVLGSGACKRVEPVDSSSVGKGPVPKRIVSLNCAATDILIAMGQLDRVVAVEEDCPCPGTENKVKIRNEDHPGKLSSLNPEGILALHPDAVIAHPDLKPALEGKGLRIIWTQEHHTYANIPTLVIKIGKLLHMSGKAQALIDHMKKKYAEIHAETKDLPKVSVYYETTGIGQTEGSVGVMNTMIELAGGVNIAGNIHKKWAQITPETIFKDDPDVIIMGPWADSVAKAKARPGWDKLKAVENDRVYKIPLPYRNVAQGTPRCVDECGRMLLPWLHPELFKPKNHDKAKTPRDAQPSTREGNPAKGS